MDISEEQANLDQPLAPARTRRFTWKHWLLIGLALIVLVSSIVVGRQVWITIHLPPQLSVKTFDVPYVSEDPNYSIDNPTMELHQIIADPDGSLYFLPDFGNWIGRVAVDGSFSRFMLPLPEDKDNSFAAWAGLSQGGGSVWASELWGNGLWKLNSQAGTLVNIEQMGQSKDYTYNWWNGVATADGSIWVEVVQNLGFLSSLIAAIGRLDPQTGALKSYPVAQGSVGWGPLTQATDGTLWITSAVPDAAMPITDSIGVIHFIPSTGAVVNFTITPAFPKFESSEIPLEFPDVTYPPTVLAGPPVADSPMITAASDGGVWVLCEGHSPDGFISYPVHISPGGVQKNYIAPDGGSVEAILPGSHQELWVIYYDKKVSPHYVLGQLSMKGGITPVGRLTDNIPRYMAVGPDHRLWMTTAYSNIVERVDLPH